MQVKEACQTEATANRVRAVRKAQQTQQETPLVASPPPPTTGTAGGSLATAQGGDAEREGGSTLSGAKRMHTLACSRGVPPGRWHTYTTWHPQNTCRDVEG